MSQLARSEGLRVKLGKFVICLPKRMFGPTRQEVTGGLRKSSNEEFRNLYSSPNITRMIRSRRMGWAENVLRMGEMKSV
jgi:hypothetical protein